MRRIVKKILSEDTKDRIRRRLYTRRFRFQKGWHAAFEKKRKEGLDTIPIIVLSYNRKSYLEQFINRVEREFKNPVIVIDNNSSYPPLLEYLDELERTGHVVHRLKDNVGHMTLFVKDEFKKYRDDFFVLSDPDVILMDECPEDLIEKLFNALERYPYLRKMAVSQNTKDIPKESPFYNNLNTLEARQFNKTNYVKAVDAVAVATDTSFALYAPENIAVKDHFSSLRLVYPYQAIHIPWMKTQDTITDEDRYYYENRASWTGAYNPVEGSENKE